VGFLGGWVRWWVLFAGFRDLFGVVWDVCFCRVMLLFSMCWGFLEAWRLAGRVWLFLLWVFGVGVSMGVLLSWSFLGWGCFAVW